MPLVKQCEETMERLKLDKKLLDTGKNVELTYPSIRPHCSTLPSLPISIHQLKQLKLTGQFSDVSIYIESYGLIAQAHKIVLSLWSIPFARVSQFHNLSSYLMLDVISSLWGDFLRFKELIFICLEIKFLLLWRKLT